MGTLLHQPLLIPPLAASMALVAGTDLPLSQPRSVLGGQLLSALTGFAVLAVAGPGLWGAAVAGGLALGVMMLARTPHSPAAATAVIVASGPALLVVSRPSHPRLAGPGRGRARRRPCRGADVSPRTGSNLVPCSRS
ncbi:hypothetical protein STANM309S_05000 [Streptomyces tanashiensis]